MDEWGALGKVLIVTGCSVALLGLALVFSDRLSGLGTWFGWIGKLPGDIAIKQGQLVITNVAQATNARGTLVTLQSNIRQ